MLFIVLVMLVYIRYLHTITKLILVKIISKYIICRDERIFVRVILRIFIFMLLPLRLEAIIMKLMRFLRRILSIYNVDKQFYHSLERNAIPRMLLLGNINGINRSYQLHVRKKFPFSNCY